MEVPLPGFSPTGGGNEVSNTTSALRRILRQRPDGSCLSWDLWPDSVRRHSLQTAFMQTQSRYANKLSLQILNLYHYVCCLLASLIQLALQSKVMWCVRIKLISFFRIEMTTCDKMKLSLLFIRWVDWHQASKYSADLRSKLKPLMLEIIDFKNSIKVW